MVINIFRILLKKYNKWIGGQSVSKDGNKAELNWIETIKKWANEQNRVMMIFAFFIHVQSVDSSIGNPMMIYLRTLFDPTEWTISFPVTFFFIAVNVFILPNSMSILIIKSVIFFKSKTIFKSTVIHIRIENHLRIEDHLQLKLFSD